MDPVHGAKRVAVIAGYVTKEGLPKLVARCSLPLTGVGCVTQVYSSHAMNDIEGGRFVPCEKLAGLSVAEVQAMTGAGLLMPGTLGDLVLPEL